MPELFTEKTRFKLHQRFYHLFLLTGYTCGLIAFSPIAYSQDKPAETKSTLAAKHDGFSIQLAAINPDRIEAFFTGRGFPPDMVKAIAKYCVISTRIENTGNQPFSYNLKKWRYETADGKLHHLKIKDDWIKEWREQGIKFSFSQLAANPTFLAGDWIASMTTYNIPHGAVFNLHYQWNSNGTDHNGIIKGVKCATR